jgi:hypothetical protein
MATPLTTLQRKPIGVFKVVYVLLLLFGLADVGGRLALATPIYVSSIGGEGNIKIAYGVYLFTLFAAGIFVFSAYLSFEAFEDRRGPYDATFMPSELWPRLLEISLRFGLVATLTLKLWQPADDSSLSLYVAAVACLLFIWTAIVKCKYGAKISTIELSGSLVLALFAVGLAWFSADLLRVTDFSLGAIVILVPLSFVLFGFGGVLLRKVTKSIVHEFCQSLKSFFAK